MDLVALKTRLFEKLVPIRRDESECVMTAVPRSCFVLTPLFQKSDSAKSETRKKRNLFVSCLCVVLAGSFVETVFCVDACVCGEMCVWCV